jgi:hypothetical protein
MRLLRRRLRRQQASRSCSLGSGCGAWRRTARAGGGRDALSAKGAELRDALSALQRATEALFMAGPACDVTALQARLAGGAAHAERAGEAAAALESDAAVRTCTHDA